MISIQFPNMLGNQKTSLVSDEDATYQNLKYLLLSDKTSFLGDPYYGSNLKTMLYSQTTFLVDILIDDICNTIYSFMPQLHINRNDVKVYIKNENIFVKMKVQNIKNYETNLYEICLTEVM